MAELPIDSICDILASKSSKVLALKKTLVAQQTSNSWLSTSPDIVSTRLGERASGFRDPCKCSQRYITRRPTPIHCNGNAYWVLQWRHHAVWDDHTLINPLQWKDYYSAGLAVSSGGKFIPGFFHAFFHLEETVSSGRKWKKLRFFRNSILFY